MFDIENLTSFADDKFSLAWNRDRDELINLIQRKLGRISEWLTKSGLKVNEANTELCLFNKQDSIPIQIVINRARQKGFTKSV